MKYITVLVLALFLSGCASNLAPDGSLRALCEGIEGPRIDLLEQEVREKDTLSDQLVQYINGLDSVLGEACD